MLWLFHCGSVAECVQPVGPQTDDSSDCTEIMEFDDFDDDYDIEEDWSDLAGNDSISMAKENGDEDVTTAKFQIAHKADLKPKISEKKRKALSSIRSSSADTSENQAPRRRVKLQSRKALEYHRSMQKQQADRELERSLTMEIRNSSKSSSPLNPNQYLITQVIGRTAYEFSLTETCFGYIEAKPPLPRTSEFVFCFCRKPLQRQAEYVYCQSGQYCNHFVHKYCVEGIYYLRTKSQLTEFCRDFTCPRCTGSRPSPVMSPVHITSDAQGTSDQVAGMPAGSRQQRLAFYQQPKPASSATQSTSHRQHTTASSASKPSASNPPKPRDNKVIPAAPLREEGKVISFVDRNGNAISTITTSDGVAHRLSLSDDYYGYITIFPSLNKSNCTARMCFCMKPFVVQAQYLYCRRGKYCNHYVHIHCIPELYYRKLYTYFRNNYVCSECAKELITNEPAEEDLYWKDDGSLYWPRVLSWPSFAIYLYPFSCSVKSIVIQFMPSATSSLVDLPHSPHPILSMPFLFHLFQGFG